MILIFEISDSVQQNLFLWLLGVENGEFTVEVILVAGVSLDFFKTYIKR